MYESFFGLIEKPFNLVPNPHYLYLSSKHQNALTHLEYGIKEDAAFILLTGEIGTGKTTMIRHILGQVEKDMDVAVVFNTNISADQLLEMILQEFDISAENTNKARSIERLYQFLIDRYSQNRHTILIIDEAQNLSEEALEEIRMLSNLQSDDRILLQIILVGQPELKNKLNQPNLKQLAQRISVNYHIPPLNMNETIRYIAYRIKKAGGRSGIFTKKAVEMIHKAANGIPRSINFLCDSCLVYGFADDIKVIDASIVSQVLKDRDDLGSRAAPSINKNTDLENKTSKTDDMFLKKLQSLEVFLRNLKSQVDQIERQVQHAFASSKSVNVKGENKDKLIYDMKQLIYDERKRNEELLIKYAQTIGKYNTLLSKLSQKNS